VSAQVSLMAKFGRLSNLFSTVRVPGIGVNIC
jgi:hypothetical protein